MDTPETEQPEESPRLKELREIAEQIAKRVKRPYLDHAELLYDEDGLPK